MSTEIISDFTLLFYLQNYLHSNSVNASPNTTVVTAATTINTTTITPASTMTYIATKNIKLPPPLLLLQFVIQLWYFVISF